MVRIVTIFATQNYRPGEPAVTELAMRSLAAGYLDKSGFFQIGYQLADFARHFVLFE